MNVDANTDHVANAWPPERRASFIAARAVAVAQGMLFGWIDVEEADRRSNAIACEVLMLGAAETEAITIATRLLIVTMRRAVIAQGDRRARWFAVVKSLVDLVKAEAVTLAAAAPAPVSERARLMTERAQLVEESENSGGWGAACSVRSERIAKIDAILNAARAE